jgi:hypothetical protein
MTPNPFQTISAGELMALAAEDQAKREQQRQQDTANGYIEVRDGYEVELARIQTKVHLLKWMFHLADKNWVTKELMMEFARRVCAVKGWNPHDSRLS